ncbi:MAG: glycosyltransferase [Desulfitobacteriaceae bacterium]
MKISVILLDWGIRESFHSIHYLNNQSAARSDYELIWIEYFERKVPVLEEYSCTGWLDKYMILGNKSRDYNKHEAWNSGVIESSGNIVVLCDSDVIFKRSFIQNILDFFESHENSFLLIDEIRSENKSFWPFSYPTWEEVLSASGLTNWNEKYHLTNGLSPEYNNLPLWEKMFLRNYGACLCVKKDDYIRYGGLDEHDSYIGYICGPYDLVVRMVNGGIQENWHHEEFLLHTYHPWVNPGVDRMGPHLWHNSTTSFKHLFDGNLMPYVENKMIRTIRKQSFVEPPREGYPKFSVIVPTIYPHFIQRLYDSVNNSTKFAFEVIFIGKEDYQTGEEHLKYQKSYGSLYNLIIQGCHQTKGEIIVIVPSETIFRHNGLDRLLDFQKKLVYPIVYLNAIETFTQGFIWQYSANKFTCGSEVCMMTALNRNLLSENLTEMELRKLFSEGKKISSVFETPVHLEIWHDDVHIYDEQLELLLAKMLELHPVLKNQDKKDIQENHNNFDEAESLLVQIYTIEQNTPGKFLKYCLLKRYSLREYYNFIDIFRQFNRIDLTIKGLDLLTAISSILTKNINENIKDVKWLYNILCSELNYYISSAHFNLAIYELEKRNIQKALTNLNSCLHFAPSHEEAKKLLGEIH